MPRAYARGRVLDIGACNEVLGLADVEAWERKHLLGEQ